MSSTAWTSGISNNFIRADLAALTAGGTLTYSGVLQILNDVASKGAVTSSELSDLKLIATEFNTNISVSIYVASIYSQLVSGSPANATWTGGTNAPVALGNLQVGTTQIQMNELIGKWFLGTDLPDPTKTSGAVPTYYVPKWNLYGQTGLPQITDVNQGNPGDCVAESTMVQLALHQPGDLQNMFVSEGNGIYGVRFYIGGNEMWVTVNSSIPKNSNGTLPYNYNNISDSSLWAELLEKAFVQLGSTGLINHPAVNSYQNISGNNMDNVLKIFNGSNSYDFKYTDTYWSKEKNALLYAIQNNEDILICSYVQTYGSNGKSNFETSHCESIVGYDQATDMFIIRNPWGVGGASQDWNTQFEASMSDIAAVQGSISMGVPANEGVLFDTARQAISAGASVKVSDLVFVTSRAPVSSYMLMPLGGVQINLNGAQNIASASQASLGEIVVAASDLSKLTLQSLSSASFGKFEIAASINNVWSNLSSISLDIKKTPFSITQNFSLAIGYNQTVSVSSFFNAPPQSAGVTEYTFQFDVSAGTINLNGAKNLSTYSNQYDVSASDLSKLTYTAPVGADADTVQVSAYSSSADYWTPWTSLNFNVGSANVAGAISANLNGYMSSLYTIADTSANIFGNLDTVQSLLNTGFVHHIVSSDPSAQSPNSATAVQSPTITSTQFRNDAGVLAALQGNYHFSVSGVSVADALNLSTNLTPANLANVSISDSAANVGARLDALQKIAAPGFLSSVTLTDAGSPTITVSSQQVTADSLVLKEIVSPHLVQLLGSASPPSNATVVGTAANDVLNGSNAVFWGGAGNDTITGLSGVNTAAYSGALNRYTITNNAGVITVIDSVLGGEGADTLKNIQHLQFSDFSINTNMSAEAAKLPASAVNSLVELYVAYFARTPDATGLSYWIDKAAAGESLTNIAKEFYNAGVQYSSLTGYSSTMTNGDFIKLVYVNVLDRTGATAPPAADVTYWDNQIQTGATTKEGLIQTMLTAAHGFANDPTWGWVPQLLNNKITVGYQSAVTYGLDYNSPTDAISKGMAIAQAVTATDTLAAVGLIGVAGNVHL